MLVWRVAATLVAAGALSGCLGIPDELAREIAEELLEGEDKSQTVQRDLMRESFRFDAGGRTSIGFPVTVPANTTRLLVLIDVGTGASVGLKLEAFGGCQRSWGAVSVSPVRSSLAHECAPVPEGEYGVRLYHDAGQAQGTLTVRATVRVA